MTEVKALIMDVESGFYHCEIKAEGHATGSAEVCAGISAVLFELVGALNNFSSINPLRVQMDPGDAMLAFEGGTVAKLAYEMTVIGLLQIEKSYPGYMKVSSEEY